MFVGGKNAIDVGLQNQPNRNNNSNNNNNEKKFKLIFNNCY